jgi:hypothetical protein
MSEPDDREKGDQALLEAPRSDPASARGKAKPYRPAPDEQVPRRSPARREQPPAEPREPDEKVEPQNGDTGGEARKSWFRRHPIAVAIGLLSLLLALPAGYVYWDHTSHFRDDRRRLYRGAPVRYRPRSNGVHHVGSGHRQ